MSTLAAKPSLASITSSEGRQTQRWLIGPWFDLLLVANLGWPLLVLLQLGEGFTGQPGLQFWQIYYVTTPHRWITLALVFLDRERFQQRRGLFLGLAAGMTALCLGVRFSTGTLTCLLAIDYVWNAWHFASQHHGIYRIYGRLSDSAQPTGLTLEKWGMRVFLLYVILRMASATWSDTSWEDQLRWIDCLILVVPVGLILRDLLQLGAARIARLSYLLSVCVLYLALLWAVHERRLGLVLSLATASALFHAIEYLALVTWSVRGRHATRGDSMGMLGYLVPRWTIAMALFVLILGAGGWLMDQRFLEVWLTINVIVAFLHYTYDGLIWRRKAA